MEIPLIDLGIQHRRLEPEITAALQRVLASRRFILGPEGRALEAGIARLCGVAHAVGVASGSAGLLLALQAAGVQRGDRVVTTPFTFLATVGAIRLLGAEPRFVDIGRNDFQIDGAAAHEAAARWGAAAVVPVHLFGGCAGAACEDFGAAVVIEDAAQALGAHFPGNAERRAGSAGLCGVFSFFPTKNLGAVGDGGIVVTNDAALAERLRRLRNHGRSETPPQAGEVGFNHRLDELQAAVLNVKLPHLPAWIEARRRNARAYEAAFREAGLDETLLLPPIPPGHSVHHYVIRTPRRDALQRHLRAAGIETGIYYDPPLHLHPAMRDLGYRRGDFPEAERAAREVLALPVYPELPRAHLLRVVETIASFFRPPGRRTVAHTEGDSV
ncbi:MAG: DegT/DnrJ/EryC1/StrS family aminotransferase [Deltaproteobacteria bacterium]|nr:MAG: DegT/DnrJ/EryC1/StrS family aminotransferase [Deltaproteobacteria bacterium]